ncbi:antirestriction protein [Enterobacter asburiae]|uniref:antirestriction protein n=1 Tax=Enterobacter asburiae TaxID=61645 RepID=UPI001F417151|nr:antirestriction protein [Enterobacter asburiae]
MVSEDAYALRYSPEYQREFWQFYRLSEGGGYLAPNVESLILCNPETRQCAVYL